MNDNSFRNVFNDTDSHKPNSFGKNVFVPFVSGVLGCSVVLGACFGVPSIKEISDYLELDEKYIVDAFRSRNSVMSLDEPVNTDGKEISPYDLIADEKHHDIDALIDLRNELAKLSDIDREIINERYHKDYTQSKVASNLGMSQVQVSRLESKILKRLKHNLTH